MLFFIISIFIIFILILVIPFKITVIYVNKHFAVYVYNFKWTQQKNETTGDKKQARKKIINKEKSLKNNFRKM